MAAPQERVSVAPDAAAGASTAVLSSPPQPKLSGRKRLVAGLKRIGSSQSLLRQPNRSQEQAYQGMGRGSISCISLNASSSQFGGSHWGNTYSSSFARGVHGMAASTPSTPLAAMRHVREAERPRPVTSGANYNNQSISSSTVPLPSAFRPATCSRASTSFLANGEDYFSSQVPAEQTKPRVRRANFDFWGELPSEISMQIFQFLEPKQIVRCSLVCKRWYDMCFDGQLWASLDVSCFYQDITADALEKIIQRAGPFVRHLNLRGCVQLSEKWKATGLAQACTNLESLHLEGCKIDRQSMPDLLRGNANLVHIDLSGMATVTNGTMKTISKHCDRLEVLNVSWCCNMDTKGLKRVVQSCPKLHDIRAGEVRGFDDKEFMLELFQRNSLERLMMQNCDSLTDEALEVLVEGCDSEVDYLTGRKIVAPRILKHLDVGRCKSLTDAGISSLAHHCPHLEGLRISKITSLSDVALTAILPTMPKLTHLDLEELESLTNRTLQELAKSPCMTTLKHLSISYCENLGDTGMLPVIKAGQNLRSLELDNTRISNLVLIEAAALVRQREPPVRSASIDAATMTIARQQETQRSKPKVGLRMVVYDCQNVTWTGIREIMSRNAEIRRPRAYTVGSSPAIMEHVKTPSTALSCDNTLPPTAQPLSYPNHAMPPYLHQPNGRRDEGSDMPQQAGPAYPHHIIALKVFYGYQPTVMEHTRRVLRGDLAAAARLERKWADYMLASEEAGAPGGFGIGGFGAAAFGLGGLANRRRRRRAHQAMMMHADEEDGGFGATHGTGSVGIGRRRRARSGGGCTVM